ncbi:Na+/H+ antiporter NhaA [Chitinophagaceae bacterium MMS25-I14]
MPKYSSYELLQNSVFSPVRRFIRDSRATGIILIFCTVISLIVSNSGLSQKYIAFWEHELLMPLPQLHLPHTVLHVINDALMAIFFLLAGMEIKRELLCGELSSPQKAMMPVIAASGGMVVPALIYYLWCRHTPYSGGWGIPMATDIAFSLGVLSLLGKKAPLSVRIFLTALAIIDDLGGIIAIALFYTQQINFLYIGLAALTLAVLIALNLLKIKKPFIFFTIGILLWYFVYNSGIHATIAGVLLAFTLPVKKIQSLEESLHDPVNFIILPLFALANTAIVLPSHFSPVFSSPVHYGIFTGLVVGKPAGIFLFCFLAVKLKLAALPERMQWNQLAGMGIIAGIGFTMSIFIATLAFGDPEVQLIAKIAIIGASLCAGLAGYFFLRAAHVKKQRIQAPVQ